MNISIASYSFHGLIRAGKMDIFGYLESVKYRYRLDAADIWNGLLGSTDEARAKKVREAMDEREMRCVNYHVDGVHVWEDDPDKREQNYKNALTHLRIAEILGAETVRIDTGGTLTQMTNEQLDFVASRFREYCKWASDHNARIGPETHWGFSLIIDNMERIARAVDHPAYGVLLHIGHWEGVNDVSAGAPGIPEEIENDRRIAPWTVHTHVDARITRSNLAERIKVLRDAGYDGCWGIEHHTGKNEYHEVAYQLAELSRALGVKE